MQSGTVWPCAGRIAYRVIHRPNDSSAELFIGVVASAADSFCGSIVGAIDLRQLISQPIPSMPRATAVLAHCRDVTSDLQASPGFTVTPGSVARRSRIRCAVGRARPWRAVSRITSDQRFVL